MKASGMKKIAVLSCVALLTASASFADSHSAHEGLSENEIMVATQGATTNSGTVEVLLALLMLAAILGSSSASVVEPG